jgi:hypothetical protein
MLVYTWYMRGVYLVFIMKMQLPGVWCCAEGKGLLLSVAPSMTKTLCNLEEEEAPATNNVPMGACQVYTWYINVETSGRDLREQLTGLWVATLPQQYL